MSLAIRGTDGSRRDAGLPGLESDALTWTGALRGGRARAHRPGGGAACLHARRNSRLVAVVSGDRAKRRDIAQRYRLEHSFDYDEYDACLEQVDAVYLALPNPQHAEYTIRAARAGVHVLREKPMAVTADECERSASRTTVDTLPIHARPSAASWILQPNAGAVQEATGLPQSGRLVPT